MINKNNVKSKDYDSLLISLQQLIINKTFCWQLVLWTQLDIQVLEIPKSVKLLTSSRKSPNYSIHATLWGQKKITLLLPQWPSSNNKWTHNSFTNSFRYSRHIYILIFFYKIEFFTHSPNILVKTFVSAYSIESNCPVYLISPRLKKLAE